MKIAFFSCHPYEQAFLEAANTNQRHQLTLRPEALTPETADLAAGHQAVCVFVNDQLLRPVLNVYELENEFFYSDWSAKPLPDADLNTLTHLPNVLLTAHQGFFTRETMTQIASTTLNNLTYLEQQRLPEDCVVVG